jgi:hypothetical protein
MPEIDIEHFRKINRRFALVLEKSTFGGKALPERLTTITAMGSR